MQRYRPEIDGLRAIAILSVFVFHLKPSLIPGGFLGVDVFFVISGYLISSGLLSKLSRDNKIDFKEFYSKRIKRIIPSLVLVVFVSLILGALFMLPKDLLAFARSGMAALTFSSNYFFSNKVDYFAPTADEFPLIHTWSLAIEEQFYIVWPLIITLIWKLKSNNKRLIFLFFLILISLGYSYFTTINPITKNASYYSFFTRGHELLIGCVIAYLEQNFRNKIKKKIGTFFSLLSLTALFTSFWVINLESNFPGILTLIPCLATALIIISCQNSDNIFKSFLSIKAFTFIGQHSYPIYLWHWPLLAFYRYATGNSYPVNFDALLYIVITLTFSILTKKYFEVPLYRLKFNFKRSVTYILVIPCLLLGGILHVTKKTNGLSGRISNNDELIIETTYLSKEFCHNTTRQDCELISQVEKAPKILLFGDSHAGHFQPFWIETLRHSKVSFHARSIDSCPPILNLSHEMRNAISKFSNHRCIKHLESIAYEIDNFDAIIIAGFWSSYLQNVEGFNIALEKTLQLLKSKNKPVLVMAEIPSLDNSLYFKYLRSKFMPLSFNSYQSLNLLLNKSLKEVNSISPNIPFFKIPIESAFSNNILLYKDGTQFK